jgi:hypothetical protein
MKPYWHPGWQEILDRNGLGDFASLWQLDAGWFEPPNLRRGGMSGVTRHEVDLTDGGRVAIFIKRQENHLYRSFAHPWRGSPTLWREFRALLHCRRHAVPAAMPLHYAESRAPGSRRAILITQALAGYSPLDELLEGWNERLGPGRRAAIITAVARTVHALHSAHLQHNCLYPKHIFVRHADHAADACLIDLEKAKHRPAPIARRHDLDSLRRRIGAWSQEEWHSLVRCYETGAEPVTPALPSSSDLPMPQAPHRQSRS